MKKPRKFITLKLVLNGNQAALLDIFKDYYGVRTDKRAFMDVFQNGLLDFIGSNSGNPDLPELKDIDHDKL